MTDPHSWVAPIYQGLADLLTATDVDTWNAPSLCEKWLVRHVTAHVTMPARLTPEEFGAEMATPGPVRCDDHSSTLRRSRDADRP